MTIKAFISYSHDSPAHCQRVLALSTALRRDHGIDVELDQYHNEEIVDWPRWCKEQMSPERSDYVLCVCTAEYYRRIEGHERPEKGKGVYWEGSLMDDELYDAKGNRRFIPVFFDDEPDSSVPKILRGWTHCRLRNFALEDSGFEHLFRIITRQPSVPKPPLGTVPVLPPKPPAQPQPIPQTAAPIQIFPTHLRHGAEELFGRDEELKRLDDTWNNPKINVATFVAFGGVGKTSLIFEWMNRLISDAGRGAKRIFDWSFYSQGTREQGVSGDVFIAKALEAFGDPEMARSNASPWDKGARLAHLVAQERTLLVLDGLEPLQYPPGPMGGKLKDPAVEMLLKGLARNSPGLCIVTTRETVTDLLPFRSTTAPEWKLEHLSKDAGDALLEKLGVKGTTAERQQLSCDVNGHALTLNILGNYLVRAHGGDIRRRAQVRFEKADANIQNGHAFKAMAAYETWLSSGGEVGLRQLAVLRALSLFDRPAENRLLEVLRQRPGIAHLTKPLIDLDEEDWNLTLSSLKDAGLVFIQSDKSTVDTHPLIREYFAATIRQKNLVGWRAAHRLLYVHLRDTTEDKSQPSVEDLQPLYQAVVHGCQAGQARAACDEVYAARIARGRDHYSMMKLGTIGADLAVVSYFFDKLWSQPAGDFTEVAQAWLYSQASFQLRALGRLTEALDPMRAGLQMRIKQEDWVNAARCAINVSELEMCFGDIMGAMRDSKQSVNFANRSKNSFQIIRSSTSWANAVHQSGNQATALTLFKEAEDMQAKRQPKYPLLYSLSSFEYCDLLHVDAERVAWKIITNGTQKTTLQLIGRCREVEERSQRILTWRAPNDSLLDIALDHLTFGRASLYRAALENSATSKLESGFIVPHQHLSTAVDCLRRAGQQHHLPSGLLSRSLLRFLENDAEGARADLEEAWEIAERGPMRLHMADIHLHRARLFRDKTSLIEARKLIEQCGYWRRKEELEDAEEAAKNW
ncbi:SEFIR domain-containing protein [Pedosphaera parvula]|uniref:SEFIR domain protein n=1 Tax=Pedosphaera parvula (strain Ellin514) TaxID=320771 RepID=B9XI84_PEDPL|nr:SEFIR domain-containing protein [Pedosphaera parvula]EEF60345.1 SEFIR domain protein [Pedosphaera parvula Ellin514]